MKKVNAFFFLPKFSLLHLQKYDYAKAFFEFRNNKLRVRILNNINKILTGNFQNNSEKNKSTNSIRILSSQQLNLFLRNIIQIEPSFLYAKKETYSYFDNPTFSYEKRLAFDQYYKYFKSIGKPKFQIF